MSKPECDLIVTLMRNAGYQAQSYRLANGDWCVWMNEVYLWSFQDWYQYRDGTLPSLKYRKRVAA